MTVLSFKHGKNRFRGTVREAIEFAELLKAEAEQRARTSSVLFARGVLTKLDVQAILTPLYADRPHKLGYEAMRFWRFLFEHFVEEGDLKPVCVSCGLLRAECKCVVPGASGFRIEQLLEKRSTIEPFDQWHSPLQRASKALFSILEDYQISNS